MKRGTKIAAGVATVYVVAGLAMYAKRRSEVKAHGGDPAQVQPIVIAVWPVFVLIGLGGGMGK